MSLYPKVDPKAMLEEMNLLSDKWAKGMKNFSALSKADVQIGTTEKELIFKQDKVSLFHYQARAKQTLKTPVIVVYGLIGRYTMADLQEDRSLIRNLLEQGVDVYAVDWGSPSRSERWLTLEDYINGYLHDCIEHIKETAGVSQVNILGICEGGVFSLCYGALHPDNIKNITTSITPIDFHGDMQSDNANHGYINLWTRNLDTEDIDRMVETYGNMPGELMGMVFQLITPVKSMTKYNIDLLDIAHDEKKLINFFRMEKWLADRPDHPGEAAKQWFKDLYQHNKLVKNEFMLDGAKIDLKTVTHPILNIYALNDHIIPPQCSKALSECTGSEDYSEMAIPGGHVGVFVSGKNQGIIGTGMFEWLKQRDL